jgi:ADP-ribose pyrophosphatase YjhB (NUDIX family)
LRRGDDAMLFCCAVAGDAAPIQPATLPRMYLPRRIKHCRACGALVQYRVPADDNRERATCTACGEIHYENPINVVGTVPVWGDQVLLCRRNIEPRHGFWTLPAGFLELGESLADGALRETVEEAGAHIEMQELLTVLNVVRVGQVHFFYRARMLDTHLAPGSETIEARLFREDEVPWDELAFRTVRQTLEHFFAERRRQHGDAAGAYRQHCGDIS